MSSISSSNHYPVRSTHLRQDSNAVSTRELRRREEFWANPRPNRQARRFSAEEAYLQSMIARRNIATSSSIHRPSSPVNRVLPQANCKSSEAAESLPTPSKETRSLEEMLCDSQTKLSNLLEKSVDVILKFPDLELKYRVLKRFGMRCLEHKELESSQRTALKIFDAFKEDIKKCYELCALDEFDLEKLAKNNFRAIRFLVALTNDWVELTSNYSAWNALNISEKLSKAAVDCEDYIHHIDLIKKRLKEIEAIYQRTNRPQDAIDIVSLGFDFSKSSRFLVNALPKYNRDISCLQPPFQVDFL